MDDNFSVIVLLASGLAASLCVAGIVDAHPHPHPERGHPPGKGNVPAISLEEERAALGIGPAAEAGLKRTMREHLEAIRDIVAALGRQDFEQAAQVAHEELGFPKHHQAVEREAGVTFPPKYHKLAMAHHQAAEDLAEVLPSQDLQTILPQLEKTIEGCVSCHRAYKL